MILPRTEGKSDGDSCTGHYREILINGIQAPQRRVAAPSKTGRHCLIPWPLILVWTCRPRSTQRRVIYPSLYRCLFNQQESQNSAGKGIESTDREKEGRTTLSSNRFALFLAWEQGDTIPAGSRAVQTFCISKKAQNSAAIPLFCSFNGLSVTGAGDLPLAHAAAFRTPSQQKGVCSLHHRGRKQFPCELALMQFSLEERSCK